MRVAALVRNWERSPGGGERFRVWRRENAPTRMGPLSRSHSDQENVKETVRIEGLTYGKTYPTLTDQGRS